MQDDNSKTQTLAHLSDDEVIREAVDRLVKHFKKKGGKYLSDVTFAVGVDWTGTYNIDVLTTQRFFRGQPSLALVEGKGGLKLC